jgi:hypothetical protein
MRALKLKRGRELQQENVIGKLQKQLKTLKI